MLECILFDMDGLLVDSEPLQYRAYCHAFEQYGIDLSMDDWIRWHSVEASTARWIERENLQIDVQQLREIKKQHYEELIAEELDLKPGVRELVEDCSGSLQLAVVSASRRESIEACLAKFDLIRHFAVLVSGDQVSRSKPFPDPYLAARSLEYLGKPCDCSGRFGYWISCRNRGGAGLRRLSRSLYSETRRRLR